MIILDRAATAYQAARAMADNHVGAVLVGDGGGISGLVTDRDLALVVLGEGLDPRDTPLGEIMSEDVVTCDIGAEPAEVLRLMRDAAVRRVPLVDGTRPVGLVTLDDLVIDGSAPPEALRDVVAAQLEVEAPQKPAGQLHPAATQSASSRTRALLRSQARAEATWRRMLNAVSDATSLERDAAERALVATMSLLCRRLAPGEARDLVAQLPSLLAARLQTSLDGPDRSIDAATMRNEIGQFAGLSADEADRVLRSIIAVVADRVSAGEIAEVRGQLPDDMKALFP